MDNKQQTPGEQMAVAIDLLKKSFDAFRQETESKLTPEQKIEYDKHMEKQGATKTINDLNAKMDEFKNTILKNGSN